VTWAGDVMGPTTTGDATIAEALRTAFATGDPAGLAGLLADEVQWHGPEPGPWDCHDRDAVLATLRRHHADGIRYRLLSLDRTGQLLRLHLAASYGDRETGEHHE
jgi:SnoaL-like protein